MIASPDRKDRVIDCAKLLPTLRQETAVEKNWSLAAWSQWVDGQVLEVHNADFGLHVPAEHGVDRLGQLGTTLFVVTAVVYPCVVHAVGVESQLARLLDLEVAFLILGRDVATLKLLQGDFLEFPYMGGDIGCGTRLSFIKVSSFMVRAFMSIMLIDTNNGLFLQLESRNTLKCLSLDRTKTKIRSSYGRSRLEG